MEDRCADYQGWFDNQDSPRYEPSVHLYILGVGCFDIEGERDLFCI